MNLRLMGVSALAIMLAAGSAYAQRTPAFQDGVIEPNDALKGITQGRYGSAGGLEGDNNGRGVNPFSITDDNGMGLCLNSGPTDDDYNAFCLGHNAQGEATITVNGVVQPLGGNVTGVPIAATNGALKAVTTSAYSTVIRVGYVTRGDAPPQVYHASASACSLNDGAGDDASQVLSADNKCWLAAPGRMDLRQFGAKGDCVTDDGLALSRAMATGRPIHASAGHYLIGTGVNITKPFNLTGDGWEDGGLAYGATCDLTKKGTYLVQNDTSDSMFSINSFAVKESTFEDLAVLQLHAAPGPGWVPTAYPPVWNFNTAGGNINITNVGLGGVNQGISALGNTARVVLNKVRGQVFKYLFKNDISLDLNKFTDIHQWVYWSSNDNVISYQLANLDVIHLGRQDGAYIDNFFSLSSRSCLRLSQGESDLPELAIYSGSATAVQIGSIFCDVTRFSIWSDDALQPVVSVNHLWHGGSSLAGMPIPNGNVLQIDGAGGVFRIGNLNAIMAAESLINQTNTTLGAQVSVGTIGGVAFHHGWNYSGTTPFAGTFTTIRDASPAANSSIYSIAHPIHPQNATITAGGGVSSGVINNNSNAALFMPSEQQSWYIQVATEGSTYAWKPWAETMIINSPALTALTVRLPPAMMDGQILNLVCDSAITTLTVTVGVGSIYSLVNAPTACTAGQSYRFQAQLAGAPVIRTFK